MPEFLLRCLVCLEGNLKDRQEHNLRLAQVCPQDGLKVRKNRVKSQSKNNEWFSIVAKDNSCRGFIPAKNKEEACEKFGMRVEECSVRRVEWTGREFVELDQSKQERLL